MLRGLKEYELIEKLINQLLILIFSAFSLVSGRASSENNNYNTLSFCC